MRCRIQEGEGTEEQASREAMIFPCIPRKWRLSAALKVLHGGTLCSTFPEYVCLGFVGTFNFGEILKNESSSPTLRLRAHCTCQE